MALHRILKFPCFTIWKRPSTRHFGTACALSSASIPRLRSNNRASRPSVKSPFPSRFSSPKSLKQPPKKIAADLVAAVGEIPGVAAMEVAGNGYINIRFDRGAYGAALLRGEEVAAACFRQQGDRRAHQHQSQQSRAYRPPSQCRFGRHFRPHAARARQSRRGAELHRQHRRAGCRRRGGLPLP